VSIIVLNEPASRRSSGGPATVTARASSRPAAMATVARSRSRTGRSTQRASCHPARTASRNGSTPSPASSPQRTSTVERSRSVGDTVTTTAITPLSRPTGSATTVEACCQGHTVAMWSDRYPARAVARPPRTPGVPASKPGPETSPDTGRPSGP